VAIGDRIAGKASDLPVQGSYKNSGQRCTAVKRLPVGNRREGASYGPAVLHRVSPEMTVVREEIFGPASPITAFSEFVQGMPQVRSRHAWLRMG